MLELANVRECEQRNIDMRDGNEWIRKLTIVEAISSIRGGRISAVELVQAFLERIRSLDPIINAYITVTPDRAIADAKKVDRDLKNGRRRAFGLLHGIPVAVKDNIATAGIPTTNGSKLYSGTISNHDATVVQRLTAEGATILGKLNMHELAYGATTDNPHYGPARNPWNLDRITGGSSGGSGAAIAASLCLGSLGTDTGGSIRCPASLCGVVGLKPTYGTVSLQGIRPLSRTLDHVGPITKTANDAAIMLQAISEDHQSGKLRFQETEEELSGLRIGVIKEFLEDDEMLDTEVARATKASGGVFESCGAVVEEVSVPWIKSSIQVAATLIPAEAASTLWPAVRASRESVGRDVYMALQRGSRIPAVEYQKAMSLRTTQIEKMRKIFIKHDILLCPTTPMTATPIGRKRVKVRGDGLRSVEEIFPRYLAVFDVLGNPALSLQCGFDSSGLPIGLQIVGRHFEEGRVLTVGRAYECKTPWHSTHALL